jgi:drug/metabolite transporter (DMT)-like permease
VGVAVLVGLEVGVRASQLLALGALLVVLLCYASGPIMTSRKLSDIDPVATSGLAAGFAALILTPFVVFQLPSHSPSASAIGSLAVLGFLCSAVALVAWFTLIREAGPGRATLVIYINPGVAVIAGALVLREHIGAASIVGMVLILAGSWLATRGRIPPRAQVAAA